MRRQKKPKSARAKVVTVSAAKSATRPLPGADQATIRAMAEADEISCLEWTILQSGKRIFETDDQAEAEFQYQTREMAGAPSLTLLQNGRIMKTSSFF